MSKSKSLISTFFIKVILLFCIIFFVGGGIFTIWVITLPIPDFQAFEERVVAQSTKIYDRTGKILLYDVHENIKRTIVPMEEISPYAQKATIAIEDEDFYSHIGVQPTAILRAFFVNISTGTVQQGGSTLTQQVVKNTILTQDKKLSRKLKEAVLALKIERTITKDEILNLYLNETPYGGNIYGIEEASKTYFGKQAKDLNLAESAYLAALPQAPTYLSPYGNNKDKLENRKNLVLSKMYELKFITDEEMKEAKATKVEFLKPETNGIRAPHFVFFILDQLKEEYGEETVRNGGFKVITTLDWETQQIAEETVKNFGTENIKKFNANNAGLVAIDPKTGQILSMVGSIDYFDIENEGNFNITTAQRQPGSSFKPFVYAAAFEKGYTPETVVFDLPTEFNVNCTPQGTPKVSGTTCYSPVNYDNVFVGPVTLKNALAQSRNIPAVKTLYLVGLSNAVKMAKKLGITTLDDNPSRYGLTLVLGGGEVTLLEMTNAYGVFASDGISRPYTGILKIEDSNGNTLKEYKESGSQVIDKNIARQISDILSDNDARTPAFGPNSLLNIPGQDVAAKTGTTNDYRDAWIIGYTPEIVVGAWAGNNDNSPMEKRVAGMIIAPMWNNFITKYINKNPGGNFTPPNPLPNNIKPVLRGRWEGSKSYLIDSVSGKLATQYTPSELIEEKILTQVHSILYWVDKNNPQGPIPSNPYNDGQFSLWEAPVRNWAASRGLFDQSDYGIPTEEDDIHTSENKLKVRIKDLDDSYNSKEVVTIKIDNGGSKIIQADYFINGTYIGTVKDDPFSLSFTPEDIDGIKEKNEVRVVVYNSIRNKGEASSTLNIEF